MERFTRLKSGELDITTGRVIKAEEFSTAQDARGMIDAARTEAERIVADAQKIYESERERGLNEGREAAKLEMSEQMITAVANIVDYIDSVEHDMVELVGRALERILGEMGDEQVIVRTVKNALAVVRNEKQLTLRVAHDQVPIVREKLNEILASYPVITDIQVVADGRLPSTGCIIESQIGVIDASLDGQLAALRKSFEKIFGERRKG
jgi:type III secretion protein L